MEVRKCAMEFSGWVDVGVAWVLGRNGRFCHEGSGIKRDGMPIYFWGACGRKEIYLICLMF